MSDEPIPYTEVIQGLWPPDDIRRAFVEGAAWWEWVSTKATMWPSDRHVAEAEAEKRFPGGRRKPGYLDFDQSRKLRPSA